MGVECHRARVVSVRSVQHGTVQSHAVIVCSRYRQSLSAQQLIDCSGSAGNEGCNGGEIQPTYQWISQNGLCTDAAYPYTGNDDTCNTTCKPVAYTKSFVNVTVNSDVAMATAVAQQPVQIVIEADQPAFQLYSSGVITGECGTEMEHSALLVGYGTDINGVQYYKMKNSWGTSWGMAGYVLIARGETYNNGAGECGIYQDPSYPTM